MKLYHLTSKFKIDFKNIYISFLVKKIETILSKLETSSRMKDYYDIYLIYNNEFKNLNKGNFRKAVEKTFNKRKFNGDLEKCLEVVRNCDRLKIYWNSYARKIKFVGNVSFKDTINCLEYFVEILSLVVV